MKKLFIGLNLFLLNTILIAASTPSLEEISKISNKPNKQIQHTQQNGDLNIQYDNVPTIIHKGQDEPPVDELLVNGIKPKEVESIRVEEDKIREASQKPLKEFVLNNNVISYKKGMTIDANVIYQIPMVLEFYDVLQNKTKFKYISPGSPYFSVKKDPSESNRLFITATQRYRSGILTIGIEGVDEPIIVRINENNANDNYSTYNRIVLSDPNISNTKGTIVDKYKERMLKQQVKLDNFDLLPSIKYEIWTLKEKKMALLGEDALNIYYVDNDGIDNKGFYILVLHKLFDLEGYDKLMFENYKNDYSVFLLNFNTNVFTIYSKETKERYRVVLKGAQ